MRTLPLALFALGALACGSTQRPAPAPAPAPSPADAASSPADASPQETAVLAAPTPEPDAATPADPARVEGAGPWLVAAVYDPGMSHVVLTAILFEGERPVRALRLGRFLNNCAAGHFARLERQRGEGTVLALGCLPMPGVAPPHAPSFAVRAALREGALVGEWGESQRGHVARWTEVGRIALPPGAVVREAPESLLQQQAVAEQLGSLPTVDTCRAYPTRCDDAGAR